MIDASAGLALVNKEPGAEVGAARIRGAVISTVNWSELLQKLGAHGVDLPPIEVRLLELGLALMEFGADDAERTAALWKHTRPMGLSLADPACLALAKRLHLPVLTADRAWQQ